MITVEFESAADLQEFCQQFGEPAQTVKLSPVRMRQLIIQNEMDIVYRNHKIKFIKIVRDLTGLDVRTAKKLVEEFI